MSQNIDSKIFNLRKEIAELQEELSRLGEEKGSESFVMVYEKWFGLLEKADINYGELILLSKINSLMNNPLYACTAKAQKKIEECILNYQIQQRDIAREYILQNQYDKAYELLDELIKGKYTCEMFSDTLVDVKESVCNQAIESAEKMETALDKYKILVVVESKYYSEEFSDILGKTKNDAIQYTKQHARTLINRKNYSGAVEFLKEANTICESNEITAMIEEYESVLKVEELNAKIKVHGVRINMDSVGGIDVYIAWENKSQKEIKYIKFAVQLYNRVGDTVACEIRDNVTSYLKQTGPIPKGKGMYNCWSTSLEGCSAYFVGDVTYKQYQSDEANGWEGIYWSDVWYNTTGRYAKVVGVDIEYMDGTTFSLLDEAVFDAIGMKIIEDGSLPWEEYTIKSN